MGSCVPRSTKPAKCKQISASTISGAVKLTSIHEAFEFIRVLGHGQYGTVREAVRKSDHGTSQKYAIKSIVKQKIAKHRTVLKRELEILTYVDHPNIIKLYETYEDELYLHLVMEICTGGDVCDRLINKCSFSEQEAAQIMKQLLSAINYLHLNNITHRDLKPENFLYESETSDIVKLCDFGMSIKVEGNSRMKSIAGTPYYLAPEVLRGAYTKACDVWSLGVFMYFILMGRHPFKGESLESIYEKSSKGSKILNLNSLNKLSENAKDLITKMLTVQPNKRITLKSAIYHPWFTHYETKEERISPEVLKNLCKYKAKSKLWQEAIKVAVKNLSNSQINNLRSAFMQLDTSKSGFITAQELQQTMKNNGFNLASEEIDGIIRNCSYIESGKINYSDFLVATLGNKALVDEEVMWEAFKIYDKKNSGKINVKDLKYALNIAGCEFTEDEFQELISEAKLDDNSDIDFDNFKIIMTCFEEENESARGDCVHKTLVKKMTSNFKAQILKARTLGKTLEG
ncbi:hypothetical protein SteCoe_34848 [Stentor coeruleus]|uniref:non-specific serine/threonine protein kinase n=1 Tax=Stentor coeruleus TaxID=5963 RepID=A0A1R2ATR8_9CILI|nr:hypothetical protein SteCoe_34848 [Stentor coeruleus]